MKLFLISQILLRRLFRESNPEHHHRFPCRLAVMELPMIDSAKTAVSSDEPRNLAGMDGERKE